MLSTLLAKDRPCHDPGKKKKRKRKSHAGPTRQPLPLPLLCFAPCAARTRRRRRPSSGHVPVILASRASLSARPPAPPRPLAPVPDRPSSPTLAPDPLLHRRRPSSLPTADSPAPVSAASILHVGSFLASSSFDFAPNPAPSPSPQSRRRAPPSAAARRRCAAASPPLLSCITAGEAHRHHLHPVRASPGRSGPASAVPPCAAPPPPSPRVPCARVTRHARRSRVHAAPRSPWARSRPGQGHPAALTWPGGAADPWGPPVSAWAGPAGCI